MLTRRSFLTGLGAAVGIVAVEPVRRYWAVGAQLSRPEPLFIGGFSVGRSEPEMMGPRVDYWQHDMPPQPIQCRCEVRGLYPDARTEDECRDSGALSYLQSLDTPIRGQRAEYIFVDDVSPGLDVPKRERANHQAQLLDWYDIRVGDSHVQRASYFTGQG